MRVRTLFVASLLSLGLLGTLPLRAADPPAAPEKTAPAASEAPAVSSDLLTPEPLLRTGLITGPCSISVKCKNGLTISCQGRGSCQWRGDNPPVSFGWVLCDEQQTNCSNGIGD